MESNQAVFEQQDALYKDLLEQINSARSTPRPGIVVYSVPEQTRMGSGANQSIIAQGEPVQYGQKMMSIPDLSHMLVNVRIHEAFINHMKDGLPVTVRVDAVPGKVLKAHVKSVANVAAPQDWMSPDVKVYQAYVRDRRLGGAAEAQARPQRRLHDLHRHQGRARPGRPVQAIVSPLEKGGKPRCFVDDAHGPGAARSRAGHDRREVRRGQERPERRATRSS